MQDWLSRLGAALAIALLLLAIGLAALGFLCAGLYLTLASAMSPAWAASLTGLSLLLLAALAGLIGSLMLRRRPRKAAARNSDPMILAAAAGEALAGSTQAALRGLGLRGLGVALAAGFLIGFSPPLRRALVRLLTGDRG
jgi:FtsH-binding integral membrane protein